MTTSDTYWNKNQIIHKSVKKSKQSPNCIPKHVAIVHFQYKIFLINLSSVFRDGLVEEFFLIAREFFSFKTKLTGKTGINKQNDMSVRLHYIPLNMNTYCHYPFQYMQIMTMKWAKLINKIIFFHSISIKKK